MTTPALSQTSIITPWIQNLQEALKAINSKGRRKAKSSCEVVLPYSGRLTASKSAFMCFTISPGFPGRTDLPENLMVSARGTLLKEGNGIAQVVKRDAVF